MKAGREAKKGFYRESLTTRLVFVMGGLVIGTALILSALAIYLLSSEFERGVQVRLEAAQAIADGMVRQHVAESARLAQWVTTDPRLLQAVREHDASLLTTVIDRFNTGWPALWLLVTDSTGNYLASSHATEQIINPEVVADAIHGQATSGLMATTGCQLLAFASAPIGAQPSVSGAVVVAVPLGQEFIAQLKAQSQTTAWLLCGSSEQAMLLGANTLDIEPALADAVFKRGQTFVGNSRVDGIAGYGRYVPLQDVQAHVIGMYGVSQPLQSIAAARENTIRLFIGLALILSAIVLSEAYLLSRRITQPLTALTRATHALGEGDLTTPLDIMGQDEIAVLAQSFEVMRLRLFESYADLARERNRYRDFLAIMPHEFKTPLSALAASLELLETDEQILTEDQTALLSSIHRSVIRLHSLVDNLLDSASIQAGQFHMRAAPNDLHGMIETVQVFTQPLLDQKGQRLQVSVAADLPWVMADPRRITQVLINLISNAHKYGPTGQPISLGAAVSGSFVRVSVSDRGAGIPLDDQHGLFQRFIRVGSKNASTPSGMGFGLALVREIIEMHHGQVGLESALGQGTTVWFALPIATAEDEGAEVSLRVAER